MKPEDVEQARAIIAAGRIDDPAAVLALLARLIAPVKTDWSRFDAAVLRANSSRSPT